VKQKDLWNSSVDKGVIHAPFQHHACIKKESNEWFGLKTKYAIQKVA